MTMMMIRKSFLFVFLFGLMFNEICAQDDCVNFDERYPITTTSGKTYIWNPLWNFPDMKQQKVTANIGSTGYFQGYLKYVPPSYYQAANASKKYPVIIYFHGGASKGNGSALELCRLFKDRGGDSATHKAVPGQVERNTAVFSQTVGGQTEEFIVISPQFNKYIRLQSGTPDAFPSFIQVEEVIDYVEQNFRIDERKIYLTGFSNGANMIVEYAASSLERAKRVAAIMPISLCSQSDHINNTARGIDPKYIGQAKLRTWFVHCESDNCGAGPALNVPNKWVEAIMSVDGAVTPRYTRLRNLDPATLYNCSDSLWHDAWSRAFDPNFKQSYVYTASGAVGANDGINKNMYEWFSSSANAVLPVTMKTYFVRVVNKVVEIKWVTADESENVSFTIERAGADQKFLEIGNIPSLKDEFGDKEYYFKDAKPLGDVSYYRLVQNDASGQKNYFDVKKVVNVMESDAAVVVTPNPFQNKVSAYIKLDKAQKVVVNLTDMTGKVLKTTTAMYAAGTTEINLGSLELPKGVYLLKVSGENVQFTKKLVKN